ncbi:DUF58 domain-containing protein [Acrocarpospora catenulata]|uniref:DUF58 domain-containing protein n=1 Tax=Acrocarpospora catenulata TaxID=2836182 RepID=UPI001BDB0C29|nr:DUF58 domain-containing protein [Acrocarpospora catenulata]
MRAPEKLLLRLEWRVVRRLDGRLQGGHRTVHRGAGTDFAGLRAYVEGDDARHIDWNVTARLNEPHLRQFNEDREMTVWLVLDRSASMAAGRPGRGKHEVLAELALVLARLFCRGGNRVGALLFDTGVLRVVPPGTERRHVLRIGAELDRTAAANSGQTTDLAAMLDAVARLARRRSLIVVVSDFIGDGDWEHSLLRLARRHEVVALRIADTTDDELPEAGLIVVEDAETGEQLIVDSGDPLFRVRFRAAVDAREARLTDGMREAGVPVHRIDTDRDLAESLVEVVARTRDRRA